MNAPVRNPPIAKLTAAPKFTTSPRKVRKLGLTPVADSPCEGRHVRGDSVSNKECFREIPRLRQFLVSWHGGARSPARARSAVPEHSLRRPLRRHLARGRCRGKNLT